ncbi:uncharacterized protein LOC115033543 [Acyrthosiphon pisum]|uniref:Uncharacterized protein n=1 Tax=Acyrthosiphon pisum TaxID=7029 RepID=A0A8R2JME1_ACYPI|nr:uncharacterized protein LOC115033543 [Acyrthosiphon pisum]
MEAETGFYNLVFILQFKDYEEFTQHVKTRIDAESYNEFNSAEKYSYLAKMYTSIYSEKPDELGNDILKNPRNYCNIKIKEDIQKLEGISEGKPAKNSYFSFNNLLLINMRKYIN